MTQHGKTIIYGVGAIVIASMLWSVTYFIFKHVSADLGPFSVTFIESFAGAVSSGLIYRLKPRKSLAVLKKAGWPLFLMGFLGVTAANSFFVLALQHIDLGISSILEKTQPIFTVILAALFLKEKLSKLSIAFGLLGLIGSVEVVPFIQSSSSSIPTLDWQTGIGVLAIIAAAVTWAGAGVLGRKLAVDNIGPANMAFIRAAAGSATALPLCLLFEFPHFGAHVPWEAIGLSCLAGFIDSVLCYVLYYYGMKYVAAGVTSIIEIITPVGSVLLGFAFLGEHLALHQCAGAIVVLVAVTALVWNEIRMHAKSTTSLEKHA